MRHMHVVQVPPVLKAPPSLVEVDLFLKPYRMDDDTAFRLRCDAGSRGHFLTKAHQRLLYRELSRRRDWWRFKPTLAAARIKSIAPPASIEDMMKLVQGELWRVGLKEFIDRFRVQIRYDIDNDAHFVTTWRYLEALLVILLTS